MEWEEKQGGACDTSFVWFLKHKIKVKLFNKCKCCCLVSKQAIIIGSWTPTLRAGLTPWRCQLEELDRRRLESPPLIPFFEAPFSSSSTSSTTCCSSSSVAK